jgi:predicted negative regulator of RcsB-dependent stress response
MKQVFDDDINHQQEWIAANWKSILLSVVFSLCLVGALQWYQQQALTKAHEASLRYFTFLNSQSDTSPDNNDQSLAISIITDFPKSPYANLARLFLAKHSQKIHQEQQALLYYQQIIDLSSDNYLKDIVHWRMANIEYHLSSYELAITHVLKIKSESIRMAATSIQAKSLIKLNRNDQALEVIRKQLNNDPNIDKSLTLNLKGQLEVVQSELNQAQNQLTSSMK